MTCCNPPSCESCCWFPFCLVDRHCAKLVDCTLMIQSTAIHSPGCTSHLLSTTNTRPQQRNVVILSLRCCATFNPPLHPFWVFHRFPGKPSQHSSDNNLKSGTFPETRRQNKGSVCLPQPRRLKSAKRAPRNPIFLPISFTEKPLDPPSFSIEKP